MQYNVRFTKTAFNPRLPALLSSLLLQVMRQFYLFILKRKKLQLNHFIKKVM